MAGHIINAAPMVIELGTEDLSTRQLPREVEAVPQHLPKFYLYARKGPDTPQLVVGNERVNMYGVETFDERSPYANHATVFANLANANANACMVHRVIPKDVGPKSNATLWCDVLEVEVDLYDRDEFGNIKVDVSGSPIIIGTAPGVKLKWTKTYHDDHAGMATFGTAIPKPGTQTDPLTSTQSTMYPILEYSASYYGEAGNNCGPRIWPVSSKNSATPPAGVMSTDRAFPYYLQMVRRTSPTASPKTVKTIMGDENILITFKKDTVDPVTQQRLFLGERVISSYNSNGSDGYPPVFGDISTVNIYYDYLEHIHEIIHTAESAYIDGFSDISTDAEDKWLMNPFTACTLTATPYNVVQLVDDADTIRFSEYTNLYMEGGSDGTMNDTLFAELVSEHLQDYLDPNNEVMENAINVESIIYDSGFPLETKFELCNFIAQRKDTFVVLSTYDVNDRILDPSEEHSLAIALRTRLQMFPESDYFGTPVMRGMIIGRSGKLRNSNFPKRLPLTAEVLIKSAKYMGSGNGRWKNGSNFDGAPGSVITDMYDISHTWVPAQVRNRNWDVGLNWVQAYDRRSFFFPALKTVYTDDTSVLNSYFTAMAICQLNKIAHAVWREFSGISHLTNAQLETRVNESVLAKVKDRFDNRFVIVPDAHHTDMDVLRGYSWQLPIKLYAAGMKTVMTSYVQAFRISDLDA